MIIEAAAAIGSGIRAHSVTLVAFGVDSVIELISAAVLIWRLSVELKLGREFPEMVERAASRIGALLLFALAVYVVVSAGWSLWRREGGEFTWIGFAVAVVAIPIMSFLSKSKLRLASQLQSPALRADAIEALACGYLSSVVVVGLGAQWLIGAWWIDGVASLTIVFLLVNEGREALKVDGCRH